MIDPAIGTPPLSRLDIALNKYSGSPALKTRRLSLVDEPGVHEVLVVSVGGVEFGIDIATIVEVLPIEKVGRFIHRGGVPQRFIDDDGMVKGVVMSRGVIMPMVDLRGPMGALAEGSRFPVLVVLKLNRGITGIVVDHATHLLKLRPEYKISPFKDYTRGFDFLNGIIEVNGRRLILLDVEHLVAEV